MPFLGFGLSSGFGRANVLNTGYAGGLMIVLNQCSALVM
ncbi:hypothetical protein B4144_1152 [Bacillus atrophaeus]|nr:hypothetical protein B4144_1152 [Bacillus atrophaeus]